MKRLVAVALAGAVAVVISGCAKQRSDPPKSDLVSQSDPPITETKKIDLASLEAKEIVDYFSEAGIGVVDVEIYTAENDPNNLLGQPNQYTSKVNFADSSVAGMAADNTVEVFANAEDAKARYDYVESITGSSSMLSQHMFLNDNILVRIEKDLTEDSANRYKDVLDGLAKGELIKVEDTTKVEEPEDPTPVEVSKISEYEIYEPDGNYVIVMLSNTTDKTLDEIKVKATFYNKEEMLSTEEESYFSIPTGRTLVYELHKPTNNSMDLVEYDRVEIDIVTDDSNPTFIDVGDKITIDHNKGAKGIMIKTSNNGEDAINYLKYMVVFYKDGKIVASGNAVSGDELKPNESSVLEVGYGRIDFDSYDVFLLEAFLDL